MKEQFNSAINAFEIISSEYDYLGNTAIQAKKSVQDFEQALKSKIVEVLKDFLKENPSVCLSGEFGVLREYSVGGYFKKRLIKSKVDLTLKINIDEK